MSNILLFYIIIFRLCKKKQEKETKDRQRESSVNILRSPTTTQSLDTACRVAEFNAVPSWRAWRWDSCGFDFGKLFLFSQSLMTNPGLQKAVNRMS